MAGGRYDSATDRCWWHVTVCLKYRMCNGIFWQRVWPWGVGRHGLLHKAWTQGGASELWRDHAISRPEYLPGDILEACDTVAYYQNRGGESDKVDLGATQWGRRARSEQCERPTDNRHREASAAQQSDAARRQVSYICQDGVYTSPQAGGRIVERVGRRRESG